MFHFTDQFNRHHIPSKTMVDISYRHCKIQFYYCRSLFASRCQQLPCKRLFFLLLGFGVLAQLSYAYIYLSAGAQKSPDAFTTADWTSVIRSEPFSPYSSPFALSNNVRGGPESSNNDEDDRIYALDREYSPATTGGWHFDIAGNDVLVFLHIQKTGGTTLGRSLVKNLDIYAESAQNSTHRPCVCVKGLRRCQCSRPNSTISAPWLFSRYSTGWRCGLHADWTELTNCVDFYLDRIEKIHQKRRYFYITILRNPVQRYISEWLHIQRGATWGASRHWCGGREAVSDEIPACNMQSDNITLEEFMLCRNNFANNRQTRMLADLELVGCYNETFMPHDERDIVLLASAKANLRRTAFFALVERLDDAQTLFEHTFVNMRFRGPLSSSLSSISSAERSKKYQLAPEHERQVKEFNRLDTELYKYAQELFDRRLGMVTKRKRKRGRILSKPVVTTTTDAGQMSDFFLLADADALPSSASAGFYDDDGLYSQK